MDWSVAELCLQLLIDIHFYMHWARLGAAGVWIDRHGTARRRRG